MNSTVKAFSRCPKCEAEGRDQSRDNLATYTDGHSYCFACHYYRRGTGLEHLRSALTTPHLNPNYGHSPYSIPTSDNITYALPVRCLYWLTKYGITGEEIRLNNFFYDLDKDLLQMPVYNGDVLVLTNGRYFGNNPEHPKYITRGRKDHWKLFANKDSNVLVLVEDYLSAIKVGRQHNSIPLFGTFAPTKLYISLIPQHFILRFWLDRDKSKEGIKQANKARQWIQNCGTIITDKDPKEYDDKEINEFVLSTT